MTDDKLTLRDRFAMAAIEAARNSLENEDKYPENIAHWAYAIADAMLKARPKPDYGVVQTASAVARGDAHTKAASHSEWSGCTADFAHAHLINFPGRWLVRQIHKHAAADYYCSDSQGQIYTSARTPDGSSIGVRLPGERAVFDLTREAMNKTGGWEFRWGESDV